MGTPKESVVLITGGSRGIGLGTARVMGQAGWKVAISGTRDETLARAVETLAGDGITAVPLKFAVEDASAWSDAVAKVESALGPVTALVCNAGISPKRDGRKIPFEEVEPELWQEVMDVNVGGVLHGIRAVTPGFRARGGGAVVAVSSLAGRIGLALTGSYYTVSKTAVIGLVRAAAIDLGKYGIRVNGILPGRIDTDMVREAGEAFNNALLPSIALGRLGKPEEVGQAVEFLCSPRASYITGVSIDVGGGWLPM